MAKNKTPLRKREADLEARSATIEADYIGNQQKFRRSGVDHASRAVADGNVEVTIDQPFPNTDNNPRRPPVGSILKSDKAEIQSRKLTIHKPEKKGSRFSATAERGAWFFGMFRRRKE